MTVRILAVCGNGQRQFHDHEDESGPVLTQSNIDHTVNSCAVGEYKSELNGAGYHHRFYAHRGRNHRYWQQICGWRAQHALLPILARNCWK